MSDWEATQYGAPTPPAPPAPPRRHLGPLLTLAGGLVLALVLGTVSANAASDELDKQRNAAASAPAAPPAVAPTVAPTTEPPAAPTTPPPTEAAPEKFRAAYAGQVDGGAASIAIAVRDGGAVAYLCDGRKLEAWMIGSAVGGKLNLGDDSGNTLVGTFDKTSATGRVTAGKKKFSLDVPIAKKPSGLYKSTATVRNATVKIGWIVTGGRQVGIATTSDGGSAPAPSLDVTTGTATLDGQPLTAQAIDGTTNAGF